MPFPRRGVWTDHSSAVAWLVAWLYGAPTLLGREWESGRKIVVPVPRAMPGQAGP